MKEMNQLTRFVFLLIPVFLLTTTTFDLPSSTAQDLASTTTVWGQVTDAESGQPIQDATISLWEINRITNSMIILKTDVNGNYIFSFEAEFMKKYPEGSGYYSVSYRLYAYYDVPSTPGYDYVPMFKDIIETGDINHDFQLIQGASVILDDEKVLIVDWRHQPDSYDYIIGADDELPSENVDEYGDYCHSSFINLSSNHLVIPADTEFNVEVKAWGGTWQDFQSFIMDDPRFNLAKGELIHVNVMQHSIPYNVNITKNFIDVTEKHIQEAEQKGLYTTAERQALKTVWSLLDSANMKLDNGLYQESYADVKEAYVLAIQIDGTVQRLYADAATSVYFNLFPIAFTATLLPYIFVDERTKRFFVTGILYVVFLAFFFSVYFGAQIVEFSNLLMASVGAIIVTTIGGIVLTRVFRQTLATIFAMARRNLLRRKTRFILTLITIIGIVMAFVSITSFTNEHGFVSQVIGTANVGSKGLLIRKPFTQSPQSSDSDIIQTFTPMGASDLQRVKEMSEVTILAPKAENFPVEYSFASISSTTQQSWLFGILGLSPNESELTDFDKLLVEGRYLIDGENNSVLISARAANELNIDVGDNLVLDTGVLSFQLKLVGLLDDSQLSQILDLDGTPMIPEKIVTVFKGNQETKKIVPCDPSEVIVLDWETASKLPLLQLSRVDVSVKNSVDILDFSRQISLNFDYWIWTIGNQKITFFGIAFYPRIKGLEIIVPWAIAIATVVITMLGAIHERRGEVVILSSVGLNPSHITRLFFAESLIIGLIGGGLGYLLGQGSYKLLDFLPGDFLVEQKVSTLWSLASFLVSITAVVVGTAVALKFSTIITPSLLLRWSDKGVSSFTGKPLVLDIPFRVKDEDIESMFNFIEERFRRYLKDKGVNESSGTIHRSEDLALEMTKILDFKYLVGERSIAGAFPFQLIASKTEDEEFYSLKVNCKGSGDIVRETVSFLRGSIMAWSATRAS